MPDKYLDSARAIEALRTGVPSSTAIALLGCSQPKISKRFEAELDKVQKDCGNAPKSSGLLIKGGFGSGKSHTLSFLTNLAIERGFVVSRVSINRETPLSDPDKLFRALADSAILPDRSGAGLFEAGQKLTVDGDGFASLVKWAQTNKELDVRFALSLQLFRLGRTNFEMRDQLMRFWCGDPLSVYQLESRLSELGIPRAKSMHTVRLRELGFQRFRFASRLLRAAGYLGWVWLIDEVELIGSYSFLQRMRSYSQIGRILGNETSLDCPGVVAALAITDDFDTAVIRGKQELSIMIPYFRERCRMGCEDTSYSPQSGIAIIQNGGMRLDPLQEADATALHSRLRQLYCAAYNWEPPQSNGLTFASSTTVRERIRKWITAWDVQRLVPDADIQIEEQKPDYDYLNPIPSDDSPQTNGEDLIDEIMRSLE